MIMQRMPVAVHAWFPVLVALAQEAGEVILVHYAEQRTRLAEKSDGSPLTAADLAAHQIIETGLRRHYPHIPVISEESADKRLAAGQSDFWLVDPLDGTREFLHGNGEFTVNIALFENGVPVLGVVHAPALGRTWLGQRGTGAWRTTAHIARQDSSSWASDIAPIRVAPQPDAVRVVASRSHADARTMELLENIPQYELVSAGSSLKFCMVAEGSADLYPRLGTTMEWDTAAAQCVLEAAGGKVIKLDGAALDYCKADWRNPHFLAVGQAMPICDVLIEHYRTREASDE
jgi:3'(2'), 5'-bisphosphate nucleotidase